jgi:hypothetical protein
MAKAKATPIQGNGGRAQEARNVADTWEEALALVKRLRSQLPNPKGLWFRGQTDARYALYPGLHRDPKGLVKEQFLFRKFSQLCMKAFPRRRTDWETLFDMQHYGVKTRLLDWSETLGVATYFAAFYNSRFAPGADASLFILDPLRLNEYSGLDRVPFLPDDPDFDYKSIYWEKRPFAPRFPIAVQPTFLNDRIFAQRGAFTIHGDARDPIEDLCPDAVKRIILKPHAIKGALEFLEIANINELTVFPDVAGIADYVNRLADLEYSSV